ncbi:NET1-associated nuclear protein 1 [Podospora australis]|uniref:NET1-associated nuclear protein 1 n=1 Tax=Podospora australis TaxID=1536484 RepID=A0AAN6X8V6_9PEZI|nr:NET1-associated nuclear protein 1 [Podospora australis]
MISKADTNGDTAALKKRKREPKDDLSLSQQKKHRRRSKTNPENGVNGEEVNGQNGGEDDAQKAISQRIEGGVESTDPSSQALAPVSAAPWKVQSPMGGRMLDIDPIFSPDERYLIVTYNTSIQVYSTEDSLLIRRIALPVTATEDNNEHAMGHIVASALSKTSPDFVWVASSDGRIWYINWTSGAGADSPFTVDAKKILDMTVDAFEIGGSTVDVLLVLQRLTKSSAQIFAYDTQALSKKTGKLLHKYDESPQLLRSAAGGRVIVAAAKEVLHIGFLKPNKFASLQDLAYRFHAFDVPDIITCLEVRPTVRPTKKGGVELHAVEVIVGCARGAIYLYSDLLSKLSGVGANSGTAGSIQPRKYHWHRRAVHSVKWSEDGNYIISGGSETVLVLWQVDTGKQDFLPHLSAAIENIAVSLRGSSYALHLDDNSTMILSTAEMTPTMYVSGIQSLVLGDRPSKDALVRRVWRSADEISTPLVAAVNPRIPSQMFLCVGNGQQATLGGGATSTPSLQVFDIASFQGVAKHAIARTNPTDANITSEGAPIIEPTATKLEFSRDGRWLASVDEWQPPERDANAFLTGSKTAAEICRQRREIHLKFWEVDENNDLQLITRINQAHHTDQPETIFDVAGDPTSAQFATIGSDLMVRFWSPRLRRRDGLAATGPDGQPLRSWNCTQVVTLPVYEHQSDASETVKKTLHSGAITFSEDGSILFAAYGASSEALVVAIDTETGTVRDVISGMLRGEVRAIKALSSCLILLSEDLAVYDIVSDELLYSFSLKDTSNAAKRLTQLAVNYESRTFALVAPVPNPGQEKLQKGARSELTVFSLEDSEPRLVQAFPQLITSVFATPSSSGFVVVDSAAQIWAVTEGAEQAPVLKSLADLGMEDTSLAVEPAEDIMQEDEASDTEMQDADMDVDMDDDYDTHAAVVAPQRLAEIFNAAPAFAMPPIQDIFYQVVGLYSTKPATS